MSIRSYWAVVSGLLFVMFVLQINSATQESQTYDEAVHLTAGYSYWKLGEYKMNPEHPPLQKLLSGLAVRLFNPALLPIPESFGTEQQYEYAREFLYRGRIPADTLLLAARVPTILLTMCLGIVIAWYARREFGAAAGLLATALFVLDPNFIAHGHYVTTDLIAALFFFLTGVLWKSDRYIAGALALGAALVSKFSLVVLAPLLLLLRPTKWKQWLAACAIAAFVVVLIYAPDGIRFNARHTYIVGINDVLKHSETGQPTYLLGKVSETGSWKYFPVAFAVKTPTTLLALLPIALVRRWRSWLWIPAVIFFASAMTSKLNIGVRHILPVYPFLFVLAAAGVWSFRRRWAIGLTAAAVSFQLFEVARIYPHYLAFFNTPSGGPLAGPNYLLDSNIDWGQDMKKLKRYMDRNGLESVCLSYFGYADAAYYGIKEEYMAHTHQIPERERTDCIGAISITLLKDLYYPPGTYQWLRDKTPIGQIGYSIYLFDLRKSRK